MDSLPGCVLMIGVTFPISFLIARTCLRGVLRLMTLRTLRPGAGTANRNVLSSQP